MNAPATSSAPPAPALVRLLALTTLDPAEVSALQQAMRLSRTIQARREIPASLVKDRPIMILEGWACGLRLLADGRRQILQYHLPGDIVEPSTLGEHAHPATMLAMTQVELCPWPAQETPGLTRARLLCRAIGDECLLRQIMRLGRLSAYERVIDWVLELRERLELAGLCSGDAMPMPLTQESIADTLGLTSVHVNRTLQSLRHDGLIEGRGGTLRLRDRAACAALVEYRRQVRPLELVR